MPKSPGKKTSTEAFDYEPIGRLIMAVGTEAFYSELFQFVGASIDCERWILMRYRRFAKPEFVINTAIANELVQFYLDGLYRLDPLLRLVVNGNPPHVVTFEKVRKDGNEDEEYNQLYRMSQVQDELIIFMPELVGTYMAFCFDRQSSSFASTEIEHVRALYPILHSLHGLHVERSFVRGLGKTSDGTRRILLTNNRGEPLHRSDDWTDSEWEQVGRVVQALSERKDVSSPIYFDDRVLYWEDLPESHHVAPGGRMFLMERFSPGYIKGGLKASLEEFSKVARLTPRERDLVNLTLRGYPTSTISEKLDLTVGTVKMYKHRLYEKLDITSERELFLQFIDFLFHHSDS